MSRLADRVLLLVLCCRVRNDREFAKQCFEALPRHGHRALFVVVFGDPHRAACWPSPIKPDSEDHDD